MTTIKTCMKRHPLLTFYTVVFGISWGGFLLAIGPTTHMVVEDIPPIAILSMVAGPIVASVLLIAVVHGREGFRDLRARLFRWRVALRWYAIALLTAPIAVAAVLFCLTLVSPVFLPGIFLADDKISFILFNLWVALTAGILEEIGWTGFAVPALRQRFGMFTTGLIAGSLWGVWHFLGNVAAADTVAGTLALSVYLPIIFVDLLIGSLVAFRILMVWVYDHTGSLLVAMLMHVSLTASIRIFAPVQGTGASILIYDFVLASVLWLAVAAVTVANRRHLWRQPLPGGAS